MRRASSRAIVSAGATSSGRAVSRTQDLERAGLERQAFRAREGARAAHGRPLQLGFEGRDVPELDIRERGTVRDRERQRRVGQAALGVERAIHRVDHGAQRAAAVQLDLPRSSEITVIGVPSASSSASTASSATWSITSVRSPPSPVPISTRSAAVAKRASSALTRSAARLETASQSCSEAAIGGVS